MTHDAIPVSKEEYEALERDKARLEFMQAALLAADFDYGELHECVLVFKWPENYSISTDLRSTIDSAMVEP